MNGTLILSVLLAVGGPNNGRRNYRNVQLPSARPTSSEERPWCVHTTTSDRPAGDPRLVALDCALQKWKTTQVSILVCYDSLVDTSLDR